MSEAGYPAGSEFPIIEGLAFDFSLSRMVAEYLAGQWQSILGLRVSMRYTELGDFEDHLSMDRPNLWLRGWSADYPDPDSFLRYGSWLPNSGWRHEQYETLIQEARRIADHGQRMALYRQAEQILVDEAPAVPINYGRGHVLIKPWLPGLPHSIIAGNILKDIIIDPH
jgi:oligopeptide transport system substrate-binding protein